MKLLAPVSTYESAIAQINAGATELYVSGDTTIFQNFNFSGRGKYTPERVRTYPTDYELKEIVKFAHDKNVSVLYAANFPFFADDPDGGKEYADAFMDYIEKGVIYGMDSLILGDIGAILFCREQGIQTHITASTFLETINADQVLFLKEIGVNRAVLSYQMTLPEIEEIAKKNIMEIEVFGHFGCSFYDGYCNLKHFFGELSSSSIGTPCHDCYELLSDEHNVLYEGDCFNFSLICGICSLSAMMRSGVASVKLVGRSRDMSQNIIITELYANAIKKVIENNSKSDLEINTILQDSMPGWWKRKYCRGNSCKYQKNAITDSFVGVW